MKKVELKIDGMHCTGCSTRLEKVLNNMDNVKANVDFESRKAVVEYDENAVTIKDIYETIDDAGFSIEE